jgi:hypothetical protein
MLAMKNVHLAYNQVTVVQDWFDQTAEFQLVLIPWTFHLNIIYDWMFHLVFSVTSWMWVIDGHTL